MSDVNNTNTGIDKEALRKLTQMQIDAYNNKQGNLDKYDGYDCPACKNKGMISKLDDRIHAEVMMFCPKCTGIRKILAAAKHSGLGNVLKNYTFDKYEAVEKWQKDIKRTAQEFCKDDKAHWFYLGGQSGAGKTHICSAIAGHYIKAGYEVSYMLWCEESKRLKALVNEYADYRNKINVYKNAQVLYIDDFLKVRYGEEPTAADMNLAFEIINHRMFQPDKITIISGEKILDEMMKYDEATISRIYQATGKYRIGIEKNPARNYRMRAVIAAD